jgi:hypothetical protein
MSATSGISEGRRWRKLSERSQQIADAKAEIEHLRGGIRRVMESTTDTAAQDDLRNLLRARQSQNE